MNWTNSLRAGISFLLGILLLTGSGCGFSVQYGMSGVSSPAKTIQVEEFYNNTDLAPANIGQNFTNRLKDYYQQNSQLRIVANEGELQIEGFIADYRVTPVAPVSSANTFTDAAALTRLTIVVRVNYVDTLEPKNSFKDRSFSFFKDFPSTQDLLVVQERLEREIFDQILQDIFNATIANW